MVDGVWYAAAVSDDSCGLVGRAGRLLVSRWFAKKNGEKWSKAHRATAKRQGHGPRPGLQLDLSASHTRIRLSILPPLESVSHGFPGSNLRPTQMCGRPLVSNQMGDLAPVLGNLPLFSIVSIPPTQLEIQEAKIEVGARYRLHRVGARAEEKHRGPAEGVWRWGVGGKKHDQAHDAVSMLPIRGCGDWSFPDAWLGGYVRSTYMLAWWASG